MQPNNTHKLIIAGFILLAALACTATFTAEFPTATSIAFTETATAAPPPTPVSQPFSISTLSFNETGQNSEYTISAQSPVILDNNDPRALAFNDQIHALIQGEIDVFTRTISELPADPAFAASFFDVKYRLLFQNDHMASIKFDFSGYTGGAHPYGYSATVNYDFNQSRSLSLDELFLPGANYLETISTYCIAELSKRDIGFDGFSAGAAPTSENYRNWNITTDGLLITFDEYQVAAYAAGPQTVVVPYGELQSVMNPQGPLAKLTQ